MESGVVRLGGKYVEKVESRRLETCDRKNSRSKSEVKCIRRPSTTKKERERERLRGGILSRAEFERRFHGRKEGRSVSNEIFSRLRDRIFNQFRESEERSRAKLPNWSLDSLRGHWCSNLWPDFEPRMFGERKIGLVFWREAKKGKLPAWNRWKNIPSVWKR